MAFLASSGVSRDFLSKPQEKGRKLWSFGGEMIDSEADARRQTAEVTALKAADQRTACAPDVSPYLAHAYQSSVFIRRTPG